jgi:molybdenum cofactor guanylyltransferase
VGVLVGGASSRMGRTKALLDAPEGGTLLARAIALAHAVGAEPVIVGRRDDVPALATVIDDVRADRGPLAGLVSLFEHAGDRQVVALACDMPFVTAPLLARLLAAPPALAIAPRRDGRWEPLFARYDAARALPLARGRLDADQCSLQGLLDALRATELLTTSAERALLADWDTPSDVMRSSCDVPSLGASRSRRVP